MQKTKLPPCPELKASFLSRLFFRWSNSLVEKAENGSLTEEGIWELNPREKCENVCPAFDQHLSGGKTLRVTTSFSSPPVDIASPNLQQNGHLRHRKKDRLQKRNHEDGHLSNKNVHFDIPKTSVSPDNMDLSVLDRHSDVLKEPCISHDNKYLSMHEGHSDVIKEHDISHDRHRSNQDGHSDILSRKTVRKTSLWIIILKTFWKEFLITQSFRFLQHLTYWISNPHFISYLMANSSDPNSSVAVGVGLCVCLFLLMVGGNLSFEHATFTNQTLELHIRSSLMAALFKKALTIDSKSRKQYSVGEMTNLMSSDCDTIAEQLTHINYVMFTPVSYFVVFYQLFNILGPAACFGLLFVALILPINLYVTVKMRGILQKISESKDKKMKLLNEILTGIKVLKLCAWEKTFGRKLTKVRNEELGFLNHLFTIRAFEVFTWNAAPFMLSVVMFWGYFYMNDGSILSAMSVFAVFSVLNQLRFAMNLTPEIIVDVIKVNVAIKRIEKFLYEDEIEIQPRECNNENGTTITMINADFSWEGNKEKPTLKDVNLAIPRGRLVAVVGQVGSGKSSLLSAMLGEIEKLRGHVALTGSIAYVSQQAWIQNETLQNNILFGKEMDRQLYMEVIKACALQPDLDLLPAGDQSEIGERGINLSGGQKQRVSLARAVYNDADIYLLDDPLSAVDSHVGKHIFDNVIGEGGLLANKTRVLVTHNIRYLPEVDEIIVMNNGGIVEMESFTELLKGDGSFTNVLRFYADEDSDNRECIEELKQESKEADVRRTLQRLNSQETSEVTTYERQKLDTIQRQLSRHLSSSDEDCKDIEDEDKPARLDGKEKKNLFYQYTKAFGVSRMVIISLLYSLYYILWMCGSIWLIKWTDDPFLRSFSDLHNVTVCSRDIWKTNTSYLSVYTVIGIMMSLCTFLFAIGLARGVMSASTELHQKMLMSVLKSPMEFFDKTPVGRITSRFSKDIGVIDIDLPFTIESWLDAALNIILTVFAVVYSTPSVLALLIPLAWYYFSLQKSHTKQCMVTTALTNKTRSPIESHFTESVMGAETIRAFKAQDRFITKMDDRVDNYHRMLFYSLLSHRWLGIHMLGVGNLACAASSFIRTVFKGAQSAGLLGLGASFSIEINGCMGWFVILQTEMETNLVSVQRITEFINSPNEAEWRVVSTKPSTTWPSEGQIEFRNYSLRYRQGLDRVLRNISFTVKGGEKIGVVGRTGAGKSSLVLSLFRIVEADEGSIHIDGVNIGTLGLHDLKEKMAIIPQDPVLFTGSLRMNLDPLDQYTDQDMWAALEHCNLREMVESLPDRLESECGEGGNNFSVGQRQLFCLARTLLRKSKILVLDEATAAVDMATDDLIQQTIRSEFKDCTVLTIAHRLNTVMDYDRILVLDRGEVTEFDHPDTLIKKKGTFYQMTLDAGLATKSTPPRS